MTLANAQRTIQTKTFQEWRAATRKAVADLRECAPAADVLRLMATEVAGMRGELKPAAASV